jgi:hypothetical protein
MLHKNENIENKINSNDYLLQKIIKLPFFQLIFIETNNNYLFIKHLRSVFDFKDIELESKDNFKQFYEKINTENSTILVSGLNKMKDKLTAIFSDIPSSAKAVRIVSDKTLVVWENFEKDCQNGDNDGYYDTLYAFDKALSVVNFTHIAPETYMWDSYVCVWNLAENGNNTEFTAYDTNGGTLGTFPQNILPGDVIFGEIHNFIPNDDLLQSIGWVQVSGTQPMNGYFAFSNKDHTLMGAIEGQ